MTHMSSHMYSGDPNSPMSTRLKVWQTEACDLNSRWCTTWYSNGGLCEGMTWANKIHTGIVSANLSAYLYWEGFEVNQFQASSYLVASDGKEVIPSGRLWAFAMWSRFVRPGARRVQSTGSVSGAGYGAFLNKDGSVAVVFTNGGASAQNVRIGFAAGYDLQTAQAWVTDNSRAVAQLTSSVSGGQVTVAIPARSVVTVHINKQAAGAPTSTASQPGSTTTTATTSTGTTTTATTPTALPTGCTVQAYEQCGGQGWTGCTTASEDLVAECFFRLVESALLTRVWGFAVFVSQINEVDSKIVVFGGVQTLFLHCCSVVYDLRCGILKKDSSVSPLLLCEEYSSASGVRSTWHTPWFSVPLREDRSLLEKPSLKSVPSFVPFCSLTSPDLDPCTYPDDVVILESRPGRLCWSVEAKAEGGLEDDVAKRLRRKIDRHLLPLMCFTFVIMLSDQVVVAQSAILGIFPGAHLNQDQFNWLATVLYISVMIFEYPQNLALQRFPIAKWITLNIFVWSIALLCHAAASSFGALVACRMVLGACEAVILPGFMIVTSMFYTRKEHTRRVGYWYMTGMFGSSCLGFIAFGLLHVTGTRLMQWQWMMIIMGIVTFLYAIIFLIFFPDSPANARFLSPEERTLAVQRIKVNQAGVENKRWKREQFVEALLDPKVWIMSAFQFLSHVPISMNFQKQIIVSQLGFNAIQTTLLSCADGVVAVIGILIGVRLASIPAVGNGYAGVIMSIPPFVGSILVNVLPSENKVALLFMYWLSYTVSSPYTIFLGWVTSLSAGHTKRITTNAIVLISGYVGLAVGPLMWKRQYQPRNRVPWIVVSVCVLVGALLLLTLRTILSLENKRRDREPRSTRYDEVYVKHVAADGTVEFLDLTDIENRDFRYAL
ncbi:hypothetical protein NMY22_g14914 [Coprinellus aureogranulatus]|nr:hypothetical protein NMY22_g14914 [Coprinellus aureogranulatus]